MHLSAVGSPRQTRRACGVATLVLACGVDVSPNENFGSTASGTMTTAAMTSSIGDESTGDEPEPVAYGPCVDDDDCSEVIGKDGTYPELRECRDGACTYGCGDGFGGDLVCPAYLVGLSECASHRCRAVPCSEEAVDGQCCPEWCDGTCYGEGDAAVCTCDGPADGCPCELWCQEGCAEHTPASPGPECNCLYDEHCPAGMQCNYQPGNLNVGWCS